MAVQPIKLSVENINSRNKNNIANKDVANKNNVAFTGANPMVATMDFIDKGGFAASFIIQDGLGFVAPRVIKGVLRGSLQKDENGNPILDEKGNKVRKYNWAYARKEGLREVITGPSAFLIPLAMLAGIKKVFGRANNVKLNYIDGFSTPFADFALNNVDAIKAGNANRLDFYKNVFNDVINKTVNHSSQTMTLDEINKVATEFSEKQIKIEAINADKTLKKKEKAAKLAEVGSVKADFMKLMKNKIGGVVDEEAIYITNSKGSTSGGSIGELINSLGDYFDDAIKNTKIALKENSSVGDINGIVKKFTSRRMGSRFLTNMGIFATVAAFYTQIPKLYNMGLKGNPALQGTAAEAQTEKVKTDVVDAKTDKVAENKDAKQTAFTGSYASVEKLGDKVFNSNSMKKFSDVFELNGPVISGKAMATLLYGFCIPPRLQHAQDKYDYGEVVVRDMTAFSALLFGAKALARLFSDGFTRLTGLALNRKDMDGRNALQKTMDYLNPTDARHSVLTTEQLTSKYTNIQDYKGGVNGFIEFIEGSGGNVKKAFTHDDKIKQAVNEIVNKYSNKSFAEATVDEIKDALKKADLEKGEMIKKFYKLFDSENGLLKHAKTYNSTFGFLSTILLVPGLIIWLTDVCEKMTARRMAKDFSQKPVTTPAPVQTQHLASVAEANNVKSENLSMAGFLNK